MTSMSTVEDVRKIFQDFLAPELRALAAKSDAMEKISEARHQELLTRFSAQDTKFEAVREEIQQLRTSLELDRRLTRLEAKKPISA